MNKFFKKIYYRQLGAYRIFFPEIYSSNFVDKYFLVFKKNISKYKKNNELFYDDLKKIIKPGILKKLITKKIIRRILNKKNINYKNFNVKILENELNFKQYLFLYKFFIRLGYFYLANHFKIFCLLQASKEVKDRKIKSSILFESLKFKEAYNELKYNDKDEKIFKLLLKSLIKKKNFLSKVYINDNLSKMIKDKKVLILGPMKKVFNYSRLLKKYDVICLFGYISNKQYDFLNLNNKLIISYLSGNNAQKIFDTDYKITSQINLLLLKNFKFEKYFIRKYKKKFNCASCKLNFQSFLTGNLSGLQYLIINFLSKQPKEIKIIGTDLFLTHGLKKQVKKHNFLFKNIENNDGYLKSFTNHDLNFIFIIMKHLFLAKLIKCDKNLENVLKLNIFNYNMLLEKKHKGLDY